MTWCAEGASPTTVIRQDQHDRKNLYAIFFRKTGLEFIHTIENSNSITGDLFRIFIQQHETKKTKCWFAWCQAAS